MLKSCRPTIAVRDKENAKVFFGQTLGLSLVDENPVGATFQCGETFLEVYPSQFAGTGKSTVAGFEVDDLEATMATFRERGIAFEEYDLPGLKTTNGIARLGPNRGSWFKDPDGNTFGLVELGQTS
jgi:catechol 2,3-dioxygenase-like lactoylglutathione lyase family enzyme